MHKNIPLLLITCTPPSFIHNWKQKLKILLLKLGQRKNEHFTSPLFRYVHSAFLPFTPKVIFCFVLFGAVCFVDLFVALMEVHVQCSWGGGVVSWGLVN
jgi:hypothetical protein